MKEVVWNRHFPRRITFDETRRVYLLKLERRERGIRTAWGFGYLFWLYYHSAQDPRNPQFPGT